MPVVTRADSCSTRRRLAAPSPGESGPARQLVPRSRPRLRRLSLCRCGYAAAARTRSPTWPDITACFSAGAPVTAGEVGPGTVRVVVSRTARRFRAARTGATRRSRTYNNGTMSNFGCGVNSAMARKVANPEDLSTVVKARRRRPPHRRPRRSTSTARRRRPALKGLHKSTRRGQLMNAPFQARAGLRDPFTAFVCDDATADMLRPVAVEHGWSPEKVNKGGLRNAVQSLSVRRARTSCSSTSASRAIRSTTSTRLRKSASRARS